MQIRLAAVVLIAGGLASSAVSGAVPVRANGFLAVSFGDARVWRVDPTDGRAAALAAAIQPTELAWSPTGHTLVFTDGNGSNLRTRAIDDHGHRVAVGVAGYALNFSPEGNRVVYQSCLLVCFSTAALDGSHARLLYRCRCAIYEPKWSPRGGRIVYIRQHDRADGGVTYTVRLRTFAGKDSPLLAEGYPCFSQVDASWSPDGTQIVFACEDDAPEKIYVVGADSGRPRVAVAGEHPAWSPDGTKLAFSRVNKNGSRTLSVLDLRTHRVHALLRRPLIFSIAWQPAPR